MRLSINDQLLLIYFHVDNFCQQHPDAARWRTSNYSAPRFTDAEVLTLPLMQGYFNCPSLKRTYGLVVANAAGAFPHLCSYKQWVARLHALSALTGQLVLTGAATDLAWAGLSLTDSKPTPLCHHLRHGRVRLLRQDGACFGKTKKGWFFGFKLHVLTDHRGACGRRAAHAGQGR